MSKEKQRNHILIFCLFKRENVSFTKKKKSFIQVPPDNIKDAQESLKKYITKWHIEGVPFKNMKNASSLSLKAGY